MHFLTLVVDEGVPYDLVIENPEDPESGLPPAKHYSIGATRPYIEIGYGAPTLEYQEKGLRAWAFNVASDDIEPVVTLSVSVDDDTVPRPPGLPGQEEDRTALCDSLVCPRPLLGTASG